MSLFKPLPVAVAVSAVLVIAAIAYRSSTAPTPVPAGVGPVSSNGPAGATAASKGASAGARVEDPLVSVIDATGGKLDASRLFELGFAGGLVIDRNTRASIEAVLNSMPEDPTDRDLQKLEYTLRSGLPKDDAERAIKLFTDYRAYQHDITAQLQPQGIPRNLQEANAFFDQLDALKRRHFDDATAQALFGQHDAHARVTMEAMFVQQDTTLTPEQKKERLDALRAKLPPEQQALIPQPVAESASQPAS